MKFLTLLILILPGFVSAQTQILNLYEANDVRLSVLKIHNIKHERCFKYKISHNGRIDSSLVWASDFTYDHNSIIEQIHGESKDVAVFYAISFNDENSITKRELRITKNSTLINRLSEEYDYDNLGRQTYDIAYNMDTTRVMKLQKKYGADGKWVSTNHKMEIKLPVNNGVFFDQDSFKLQDSLFYDSEGRVNSWQYYDSQGKKAALYLYNYEGMDEKTVTIIEQLQDTQQVVSQTRYNKNGLIVENLHSYDPFDLYPDEEISVEKYYYNNNGTINTSLGYLNGKVVYIHKFFYDN